MHRATTYCERKHHDAFLVESTAVAGHRDVPDWVALAAFPRARAAGTPAWSHQAVRPARNLFCKLCAGRIGYLSKLRPNPYQPNLTAPGPSRMSAMASPTRYDGRDVLYAG